jgi:hypothetical protein
MQGRRDLTAHAGYVCRGTDVKKLLSFQQGRRGKLEQLRGLEGYCCFYSNSELAVFVGGCIGKALLVEVGLGDRSIMALRVAQAEEPSRVVAVIHRSKACNASKQDRRKFFQYIFLASSPLRFRSHNFLFMVQ